VLSAEGVAKRFTATQALERVSLALRAGEVHALVGENGAGKSTLIRIFGGVYAPDAGRLRMAGSEIRFGSPADAYAAGIATIAQELRVVPALSVAENVMLGHLPARRGVIDWRRARERAREALGRLRLAPDPDAPVGALSFAARQSVATVRAETRSSFAISSMPSPPKYRSTTTWLRRR
jgi:ABC-type sugar transport system ATPase subunit